MNAPRKHTTASFNSHSANSRAPESVFGDLINFIFGTPPPKQGRTDGGGERKEINRGVLQARWPPPTTAVNTTNNCLITFETTDKNHRQYSRVPVICSGFTPLPLPVSSTLAKRFAVEAKSKACDNKRVSKR